MKACTSRSALILGFVFVGCTTHSKAPPLADPTSAPRTDASIPTVPQASPSLPTVLDRAQPASIAGGSKSSDVLIYDGKSHSDRRIQETVAPGEQATLLSKIFPKYLKDAKQCSGKSMDLADARRRGDIVPTVRSAATGSFTAPGRAERLYLVFVGECGASHADNFGSSMLVVTDTADTIQARIGFEGGTSIHRLVDLEGDGRLEVVLTSGFMGQGILSESASLVRVGPAGLTTIKDFGQVMEANCASALEPHEAEISVIHAVRNGSAAPEFRIQKTTRPCE